MTKRPQLFLAFALGAILVLALNPLLEQVIVDGIQGVALVLVAIIVLLVILVFVFLLYKDRILGYIFGKIKGEKEDFSKSLGQLTEGIMNKEGEVSAEATQNLANQLGKFYFMKEARGRTLLIFQSLFVLFGAVLGTVLIRNQNELFESQNAMIEQQTRMVEKQMVRLDQQTYLQEAERRSGLVFLFSNIMDLLDQELKEDYNKDGIRNISPQLSARIISLSQRLEPYYYLDNDSLTSKQFSPERGQLFTNLVKSNLDQESLNEILSEGNFQYSVFSGVSFNNIFLEGIDLSNSKFNEITFDKVKLSKSKFNHCQFISVKIEESEFEWSEFMHSDLVISENNSGISFRGSKFNNSSINIGGYYPQGLTDFKYCDIFDTQLNGKRDSVDFSGSKLFNFNYRMQSKSVDLSGVIIDSDPEFNSLLELWMEDAESMYRSYSKYPAMEKINYDFILYSKNGFHDLERFLNRDSSVEDLHFGIRRGRLKRRYVTPLKVDIRIKVREEFWNDKVRNGSKLDKVLGLLERLRFDYEKVDSFKNYLSQSLPDSIFNGILSLSKLPYVERDSITYQDAIQQVNYLIRLFKPYLWRNPSIKTQLSLSKIELEVDYSLAQIKPLKDHVRIIKKNKEFFEHLGYYGGFSDGSINFYQYQSDRILALRQGELWRDTEIPDQAYLKEVSELFARYAREMDNEYQKE